MPEHQIDFDALKNRLLQSSHALLESWLPSGKWSGAEYRIGNLKGEPGDSLSINANTGLWADFSSKESGGDLIALYAAIHGLSQSEAARELDPSVATVQHNINPKRGTNAKHHIIVPPVKAPSPDFHHTNYGKPAQTWAYTNEQGQPLFYIVRYNLPDGSKQIVPVSWSVSANKWVKQGYPAPRPILGLQALHDRKSAPVLIVEGEPCYDAAIRLAGVHYVVVTWAGGCKAYQNSDFSPLSGRQILIWPDADRKVCKTNTEAASAHVKIGDVLPERFQPGMDAAYGIARILAAHCQQIKIIHPGIDLQRKDGWDAADALREGWQWEQFLPWAKPLAQVYRGADVIPLKQPSKSPVSAKQEQEQRPESVFLTWADLGLVLNGQGNPVNNLDNVQRILDQWQPVRSTVWFDEFHRSFYTSLHNGAAHELGNVDIYNYTIMLQRKLGCRAFKDYIVKKALYAYGKGNTINEPKDWMESLVWDEIPRLEQFFVDAFGAVNNAYTQAASKNFWIGMVARIYSPGCQMDNVVVLEGPQGIFKSTALRVIGGKWHTEAHESVTNKDFYIALQGKMLIEIAELQSFSASKIEQVKRAITNPSDRYRAPYEAQAEDHPRACVFVCTTNERHYLRDMTGARRFWPVECTEINLEYIRQQRNQLFAEAVACFKRGDNWHTMPMVETSLEQELRREVDEWESVISTWLLGRSEVTVTAVLENCLEIKKEKHERILQRRVTGILRLLKWTPDQRWDAANRTTYRYWKSPYQRDMLDL